MAIPNLIRTLTRDFKVGDIYMREREFEFRIVRIRNLSTSYVQWDCEWTGNGPRPHWSNERTFECDTMSYLWRLGDPPPPRPCAPCYDSDCECVYDVVEG